MRSNEITRDLPINLARLNFKTYAQKCSSWLHCFLTSKLQRFPSQFSFGVHWPLSRNFLVLWGIGFLHLQTVQGGRCCSSHKRSTWWPMSFLGHWHVMVMYTLVCYDDGIWIIYSGLNVLSDRTSSRSASVVVPEKFMSWSEEKKYITISTAKLKKKTKNGEANIPYRRGGRGAAVWLLFQKKTNNKQKNKFDFFYLDILKLAPCS